MAASKKSMMRALRSASSIAIECNAPSTVTNSVATPAARKPETNSSACCNGIFSTVECPTKKGGSLVSIE